MDAPTDEQVREQARKQYAGDDIELEGDAAVSRGDDPGAFVAAWVWVDFSDIEGWTA